MLNYKFIVVISFFRSRNTSTNIWHATFSSKKFSAGCGQSTNRADTWINKWKAKWNEISHFFSERKKSNHMLWEWIYFKWQITSVSGSIHLAKFNNRKKIKFFFSASYFCLFAAKKKIENFNFVLYHHTHLAGKTGWLYSTELMWCVEYKFLIELFFMIFWLQCTWVYEKEEKKKVFNIYHVHMCCCLCVYIQLS